MDQQTGDVVQYLENLFVFPDPKAVEEYYEELRGRKPNGTKEEIWGMACNSAKAVVTGQGIVSSLPGAIPGLGTAAQLAVTATTITGETYILLRKMAYLQLLSAKINGHDVYHSDRKDELMVVLGVMTGAVIPAKEAAKRLGTKFAQVQAARKISGKTLQEINKRVGFTLLTKMGTKRGGLALGRLIPLGVGAVIGGAANFATINSFVNACHRFYTSIDDGVIVVD